MDLCVTYDDVPSHVSWHQCAYIPSFGLVIRQRLAKLLKGLEVEWEKIMPASPCHPVV